MDDFLVFPMTMTKMVLLMDLILSALIDYLRGLRGGGMYYHSHYPLTLCYKILGAAFKVVNWGVRNRRRKDEGGGSGGGSGDVDGNAGNRGVADILVVSITMTTMEVMMALIPSSLIDFF